MWELVLCWFGACNEFLELVIFVLGLACPRTGILPFFLERYNSFIIQHIDNKTKFEEKILSKSPFFLHFLVKMLKFTSIVGYTSCEPTYIESFLIIFGQCINVLNYNNVYQYIAKCYQIYNKLNKKIR